MWYLVKNSKVHLVWHFKGEHNVWYDIGTESLHLYLVQRWQLLWQSIYLNMTRSFKCSLSQFNIMDWLILYRDNDIAPSTKYNESYFSRALYTGARSLISAPSSFRVSNHSSLPYNPTKIHKNILDITILSITHP